MSPNVARSAVAGMGRSSLNGDFADAIHWHLAAIQKVSWVIYVE